MNSGVGRTALIAIGVIALVTGVIFGGQGAGLIGGSVMTGDPKWLYIGIGLAVVGAILLVVGLRKRGGRPAK